MLRLTRCTDLLEVIHRSFIPLVIGGHKYFIKLIDAHSCYGFVKFIRENSDSLKAFNFFFIKSDFIKNNKRK